MLRTGLITIAMIVALQGLCLGQGFLDSFLGPGGLGLWGGDAPTSNPQMWGGAQGQPQQQYQQPGLPAQQQTAYPPGYPPQGYGSQQAPGYGPPQQQQGVYSDWNSYPPAPIGGDQQQYSSPQQQQAPQQYSAPQQQQYPAQQQYPPQQQYAAPPAQAAPARPAQAVQGQPALRPGQYVPGPAPGSADDLPSGAVRVTTTTPQGTRVEYYPPTGEPGAPQGAVQRPARQPKPKPAAAKAQSAKQGQPREQTNAGAVSPSQSGSPIAMPKPVEIPEGQDPRYGWGAAVNRGPVAPPAR